MILKHLAAGVTKFMSMNLANDYIPVDILKDATAFFKRITEDVEIYKKIKLFDSVKTCFEADKFVAWWDLQRYADYNHSLFLLYECQEYIDSQKISVDILNSFDRLQSKLVLFYQILERNSLIGE